MLKEYLFTYLWVLILAGGITYLTTFIIKFLARRFKIVDQPNERKIHTKPIPRLGGIGIYLGFVISMLAVNILAGKSQITIPPEGLAIIAGGLITLLIGVMDDLRAAKGGVPAAIKLLSLFVITFILARAGVIVNFPFLPYWINLLITLGWIVGITSAFNAIDHMDGLASGLAFIAGATYLAVAIQTYQWQWGILAAALMGANLGFLRHNFNPATIFMGDSGSFCLGFILATMGIMGSWSTHPIKAAIIPVLILGIPLFDLVYLMIKRQRTGVTRTVKEIIVYSGKDHLGHRIMGLGLSHKKTVLFIYLIALCITIGAFVIRNTNKTEAVVLLGQVVLIVMIIFTLIELKKKKA